MSLILQPRDLQWKGEDSSAPSAKPEQRQGVDQLERGNETPLRSIRPHPISLWLLISQISEGHGNTTGFSFAYSSFKTNKDITSFPERFSLWLYTAKEY